VALADRLAAAGEAQQRTTSELDTVQAERAEAEAALARQLLAQLRVAPREREGGGGRRRKAGGHAPTAKEEQGAPAAPLKLNDGNDGNEK
ncbi:MAG: DNA-binding protein, partial [Cupriavidus necator]